MSEELVLGPSGLSSTDRSTQIEQVGRMLPSRLIWELATDSSVLLMTTLTYDSPCS